MVLANKDEYKYIIVDELGLSVRSSNALRRANIHTLYQLVEVYNDGTLLDIRNLGKNSFEEIKGKMFDIAENGIVTDFSDINTTATEEYIVPEEIENIEIRNLQISVRLMNCLIRGGYQTVGSMLRITTDEFLNIRNAGADTLKELRTLIAEIGEKGITYFEDHQKVADEEIDEKYRRSVDIATVQRLCESYGFKTVWLTEWYGVTRQRVSQMLDKRINRGNWLNREFGEIERVLLSEMLDRRLTITTDGRNELIEFLVRNNVLPKYGFPVDTVELYQGMDASQEKKLQMVRDLQLAIAEYAPDAQVVADGRLYTSRYIRKLPQATGQDWEEVYIAECKNKSCMTWNYRKTEPSSDGECCISCQMVIEKARWKKAIEPRKGFIAESKPKAVPLRKPDRSFKSEDYYIGDPQRQVMTKKTFLINGVSKIQMETSTNDSLMVVCKDDFFVCERCGYSISSVTGKGEKDFNSYAKSFEKKHISPWGKDCAGKLYKRELCHAFKTDVVQLVFGTSRAKNQATMLSVMYALLEAMSDELDIERTDIKGCLHKVRYENSMIYSVVLYDAVAGGAGHVRRLVTDDCAIFRRIVSKAIGITKNCNCNPSCYNCLRNYYNQTVHEILNRVEAYRFLEFFSGGASIIPDENFEEVHNEKIDKAVTEDMLKFGDSFPCQYNNWNEFAVMIPDNCQDKFEDFDFCRIPLPSDAYCKCKVQGTDYESEILLLWRNAKIMVFEDDKQLLDVPGWSAVKVSSIRAEEFKKLFS